VGKTYQLEWTDSLASPVSWTPVLSAPVPGTGLPITLSDTNPPTAPSRFYRISSQ
jgi:hypothetical protein